MRKSEPDEPQDDLDVEITSLDEGKSFGLASDAVRMFARRHRRPLTAATAGMVALAILLIVLSTSAVRGLAVRVLNLPAPTATRALYPGEDLFFVRADPAWGHLTIDGRAITSLPVVGTNAPLRLARGQHVLVWSAEPFQAQRCTLSVPASYLIDTCIDHSTVQIEPGVIASIVEFRESLTTLAPEQRAALVQAVQEALDTRQSTVIMQKGELYALAATGGCQPVIDESHCYAVATQPMFATLHFRLDANPTSNETCLTPEPGCTFLRESCFRFCPVDSTAANVWTVLAPVLPLWTFQAQDGSIVERDVPDNVLWDLWTEELADESLVGMQITWQSGAWQVNIPVGMSTTSPVGLNPVCEAAQNVVGIQYPPIDSFGDPLYLQWQYASGVVPASGCLGVGLSRQDTGSVKSTINTPPGLAYCLLRFGVLLAVNAEAHRFWPHLPQADAYEQSLAQQLEMSINNSA
ncbi:MAG TPA: hypothetical protein VFQ36_25535 [Ktedonobacteraceae bacterium]|nr:hypothetical protein [Ktedonobacteraceae bacterium]